MNYKQLSELIQYPPEAERLMTAILNSTPLPTNIEEANDYFNTIISKGQNASKYLLTTEDALYLCVCTHLLIGHTMQWFDYPKEQYDKLNEHLDTIFNICIENGLPDFRLLILSTTVEE